MYLLPALEMGPCISTDIIIIKFGFKYNFI